MSTYPTCPNERAERAKRIRLARIAERVARRFDNPRGYSLAALAYDRAEGMAGTTIVNDILRARFDRMRLMAS